MSDFDPTAPIPPYARPQPAPLTGHRSEHDERRDDDGDPEDDGPLIGDGLPPGYRMRHDRHYVDALYEPREQARHAARHNPALVAVVRELATTLRAIDASAGDIDLGGRSLRDRAAVMLTRAESQRAAWLADAAATLADEPTCALAPVDLRDVVARIADGLEPAHRLVGIAPSVSATDAPSTVLGDARLLEAAVGGIVVALGTIVETRGVRGRLTIRLAPARDDSAQRTIEVSESGVTVPARVITRFFDEHAPDHPAGLVGAVLLAGAQAITRLHGGRLGVSAVEGSGCTVTLTLRTTA